MPRGSQTHRTSLDVLNYEIVQEQASALGRMGRALEAALAKLPEFDALHPPADVGVSAARTTYPGIGGRPRALDVRGPARGVWPAGPPQHHEKL
jgi:hypothetical protein